MQNYTVNNILIILSAPSDVADAVVAAIKATHQDLTVADDGSLRFVTDWEPPLKEFANLASRFPNASMELIGEAFASQHWICVATAENGKTAVDTLTRIDGEQFETAFRKVFGRPFQESV